jgi:hypothetical protein
MYRSLFAATSDLRLEIHETGITIMHFQEGKVVERWDIDDSAEAILSLRGGSEEIQ